MKQIFGFALSCLVIVGVNSLQAQTENASKGAKAPAGYTLAKSGLAYKMIRQTKSAQKPAMSDVLTLNLSYALYKGGKGDSVMFDSRKIPQQELMVQLMPSAYAGDLMEGLSMLANGDSASFITRADSFFLKTAGVPKLPPGIKTGDKLVFQVGLTKYATLAQLQAEQAATDSIAKAEEAVNREKYLAENKITEKPSESGLIIQIEQEGTGSKPQTGQKVTVHYTGYLLNGSKFDSSVGRGEPFTFTIGQGQVIKGWDEGVAQLKTGTKAKLIIPSSIGYGAQGAGANIPPFSTLIFEVELLKTE